MVQILGVKSQYSININRHTLWDTHIHRQCMQEHTLQTVEEAGFKTLSTQTFTQRIPLTETKSRQQQKLVSSEIKCYSPLCEAESEFHESW